MIFKITLGWEHVLFRRGLVKKISHSSENGNFLVMEFHVTWKKDSEKFKATIFIQTFTIPCLSSYLYQSSLHIATRDVCSVGKPDPIKSQLKTLQSLFPAHRKSQVPGTQPKVLHYLLLGHFPDLVSFCTFPHTLSHFAICRKLTLPHTSDIGLDHVIDLGQQHESWRDSCHFWADLKCHSFVVTCFLFLCHNEISIVPERGCLISSVDPQIKTNMDRTTTDLWTCRITGGYLFFSLSWPWIFWSFLSVRMSSPFYSLFQSYCSPSFTKDLLIIWHSVPLNQDFILPRCNWSLSPFRSPLDATDQ